LVERLSLKLVTVGHELKFQLKNHNVIGNKRGPSPKFLNKETIQEIVRTIDTPQTKAIYYQLWEMAEDTKVHMSVKLEAAGSPENMLKLLNMNDELSRSLRIAVIEQIEVKKKLEVATNDRLRLVKDVDSLTNTNLNLIVETETAVQTANQLKRTMVRLPQVPLDIADEPLTPTQKAKLHAIKLARLSSDRLGGHIPGYVRSGGWMAAYWKHVNIMAHSNSLKEIRQRHYEQALSAAREFTYGMVSF
jgi:hypothetical protein